MEICLDFVKEKERIRINTITNHSHLIEKQLEIKEFPNATILPQQVFNAGVVDEDGHGILGTNAVERYRVGYDYDFTKVKRYDESVIYMGYIKSVFGHCITDDIKRLWVIGTEKYKNLKKQGIKCVYISPEDEKPSPVFRQILSWLGEDLNDWQELTDETQYKMVYIPDNSLIYDNGERFWTKEFRKTINIIKAAAINSSDLTRYYDKIYLSRSRVAEPGREMGERSIERAFVKWGGYFVIHPELHSLADQIALVDKCLYLATTEGSVSHLAVFCKSGTSLVIIRKADYINTYQVAINEVADLKVTYIDAHHSHVADERWPWSGPFYLCTTTYLHNYFGKNPFWVPPCLHCMYWWYRLRQTKWMQQYVSNRHIIKKIEKRWMS